MVEETDIQILCPECRNPLVEQFGAHNVRMVAGGSIYLECVHCPRTLEVTINYTTRWVGEK